MIIANNTRGHKDVDCFASRERHRKISTNHFAGNVARACRFASLPHNILQRRGCKIEAPEQQSRALAEWEVSLLFAALSHFATGLPAQSLMQNEPTGRRQAQAFPFSGLLAMRDVVSCSFNPGPGKNRIFTVTNNPHRYYVEHVFLVAVRGVTVHLNRLLLGYLLLRQASGNYSGRAYVVWGTLYNVKKIGGQKLDSVGLKT